MADDKKKKNTPEEEEKAEPAEQVKPLEEEEEKKDSLDDIETFPISSVHSVSQVLKSHSFPSQETIVSVASRFPPRLLSFTFRS